MAHLATQPKLANPDPTEPTIKLHPTLALAILKAEQAAAGRIWLLARHLDKAGQGWLPTDQLWELLTRKASPTRVCGRRQLRNLLNQGQDIYWQRQPAPAKGWERIWLKSPARVAAALGLERLAGRPVEIPLEALLGGIGQLRAHFYATFHRQRQEGGPISRDRLAILTHVPPRTQRLYDKTAGVQPQANYAIGPVYNRENLQERAWQHGRGIFKFVDHQGRQGQAGNSYVAWRLPNSYAMAQSAHGPAPSPERKRNKLQPADLVTIGAQGNDRSLKGCPRQSNTLFHADGGAAGQAYNRDSSVDAYWPDRKNVSSTDAQRTAIWQVIGRADQGSQRGGN